MSKMNADGPLASDLVGRTVGALFWIAVASFVVLGIGIARAPIPWIDETILASSALSVARGGTGVPTFTAHPEEMLPMFWFYGPVYFKLAGWVMKTFGISIASYRFVSFASTILLVAIIGAFTWVLSRSRRTVLVAMTVSMLLPEFGAQVAGGRMDPLAVMLMLGGITLFLTALQEGRLRVALATTFAGAIVFGLAMLTTPRCFPAAVGLAVSSAVAALVYGKVRKRLLLQMLIFAIVVPAIVMSWTFAQGFGPFGWLHIIQSTSKGDPWNSSPLLGGNWNFRLVTSTIVTIAAILVTLPLTLLGRARAGRLPFSVAESIATGTVVINSLVTIVVISRPFDYLMFWATPLLMAIVALSHPAWETVTAREGRRLFAQPLVVYSTLLIAFACLGMRLIKHLEIVSSWQARDPAPIGAFVREHIPAGSEVFGSFGYFFWAVELNGSSYRSANGWSSVGRRDLPEGYDPTPVLGPRPAPISTAQGFLLWPDDEAMTDNFVCATQTEVARFQPTPPPKRIWDRLIRRYTGYAPAKLYRVENCRWLSGR